MIEPFWTPIKSELLTKNAYSENFLGDGDATIEWKNENRPLDIFIHTKSYEIFKQKDRLYLFGQRGSGKTAMMNMLLYEVKRKRVKDYGYAWLVDQEEAYCNLSIHLRSSQFSDYSHQELVHIMKKGWEWLIYISAMASIVKGRYQSDKDDKDLTVIINYLRTNRLLEDDSIKFRENFLHRISENIIQNIDKFEKKDIYSNLNSNFKSGIYILEIINSLLFTTNYDSAKKALLRILNKLRVPCLVMIDSKELYSLNDRIEQAGNTALIEVAMEFYKQESIHHILVKVAFPSEFSSKLIVPNKEKMLNKSMYILWTYRDIVCFIAKRYMWLIEKSRTTEDIKRLDNFSVAQHYLYKHLPEKIPYGDYVVFDTMAYIIRHTHKKPRQVISLFNAILSFAKEEKNDISKISSSIIIKGIHSNLDELVNGCLNMYTQIYPKADEIVKRGLHGTKSYIDYSELDKRLKEVSSLRAEFQLSSEDVKRLLLECGVLGIQKSRSDLHNQKIALVEALFEYQVKDKLTITNKDTCVIHPMFYEPLEICIDANSLVYPKPAEDEEIKIYSSIGRV